MTFRGPYFTPTPLDRAIFLCGSAPLDPEGFARDTDVPETGSPGGSHMKRGFRVGFLVGILGLPAAVVRADVVTDWNAVMVATVSGQNPFAQARFAAITQLAVYEAVNSITRKYQPYLPEPIAVSYPASSEAAAVAAAHRVLVTYFPGNSATLDLARDASLGTIHDGAAKVNGIAAGEAAAAAMIALRASDGSSPPAFYLPASTEPGIWQPTPACPAAGGVLLHWQTVTPFAIKSADQFRSAPPPPLTSRRYARDLNEVKEVGAIDSVRRTGRLADVARFYAAVLAVATWNPAVAQATLRKRHSVAFNARLFALLNMAISDGAVAVMDTKYEYVLWRPETAIQAAGLDGNRWTEADPAFVPFITAPCFPSYGSAHAAASYAARAVAESVLGDDEREMMLSSPAVPGVVLEYASFGEITEDIDDARVYGGIHFRFDQRAGSRQGRKIGAWVVNHHLRPVR
jgi:hypothetical protein